MMAKRDPSDRLHLPQAGKLVNSELPLGKRHSPNPSTHFTTMMMMMMRVRRR